MKHFVRGVLEKSPLKSRSARDITEFAVPLFYHHASFRWHLDSRAAVKLIAVHDFLSSSNFCQDAFYKTITTLPLAKLTLTEPLELYAVDLRGHHFSEKLWTPAEVEESYAWASAGDIVRLQREVVVNTARVLGVGFGAMVAALAALAAPEAVQSLTLLVKDYAQLYRCDPTAYDLRAIIQDAPKDARTIADLNAYLKPKLPHPLDREFLLGNLKEDLDGARFRFNERLLMMEKALTLPMAQVEGLHYPGPVKVIIYGGPDPSEAEMEAFKRQFPTATFHTSLRADRGFYDSEHIGKILLNSLDIVGAIEGNPEEE
ncbi:unnamed protein product [Phytomonas sp. Hart1]|nr:unnamed protein product [Phytomonas sp. Hart1]|eukprot:CCW67152.1 unnamed protein product [Phytomonas sp. isolate Hart1]